MLRWIESHPKSLVLVLILILGLLWLFVFDFDIIPILSIAPLFAVLYLTIVFGLRHNKRKTRFKELDFHEYKAHQEITIDAIMDIFHEEKPDGNFRLPVILTGKCIANKDLKSPLSQKSCLAYHLRVELLTPRDLSSADYSYLLINKDRNHLFKLEQQGKEISIATGGFCQFKNKKQKNYTWSHLSRLPIELKQSIEKELKLKTMDKNQFTGFRVIEEILSQEDVCTVYGMCEKTPQGIVINGNHQLDHPESLTITSITPKQRLLEISQLKQQSKKETPAFIIPLILLIGIPSFLFIRPRLIKSGEIYFIKPNYDTKLDIRDFANEPDVHYWWNFKASEESDDTRLNNSDSEVLYGFQDSQITISKKLTEYQIYEVGIDPLIQWQGSYYYFEPKGLLPTPYTPQELQKGRIYLKNKSNQEITITFSQKSGEIDSETHWIWPPSHGMDYTYGNYATYYIYGKNDEVIEEKQVLLETGDQVFLHRSNELIRIITLGVSQGISFVQDTGWIISMDDTLLKPRKGKIYYKNPTDEDYTMKILDSEKQSAYAASWNLDAGEGVDENLGLYLIITNSEVEEDIYIEEGMFLEIGRSQLEILAKGKLGELPQAQYDYLQSRWQIDPEKSR